MKKFIKLALVLIFSVMLFACTKASGECELSCDNIYLMVGETYNISPNTNVSNPKYTYSVNGSSISVSNGVITGKELGESTLTIGVKGYTNTIDVVVVVCDEGLTIVGKHQMVIDTEMSLDLAMIGVSEDEKIVWRSSNTDVARVVKGVVTAVGLGNTTISVKSDVYQAEFALEVIRPTATSIETTQSLKFENGASYSITYVVYPNWASQDVTITINNDNVSLNSDNSFKANKVGNSIITLTSNSDTNVKAEIEVEIIESEKPQFIKAADYNENVIEVNYNDKEAVLKGITASDNADGDVTDKITFDESLIQQYGNRTVTFTVTDYAGNTATMTREVNVVWNYKTKFIGHAGCLYGVPNTEEAFLYAASVLHYQAIECDLQVTSDGIYVTNHDSTLGGLDIGSYTYSYLKTIIKTQSVSGYIKDYNLTDKTGFTGTLCTLERYLEICKEYGCEAVIELKGSSAGLSDFSQDGMQKLVDFIKSKGMWEDTIFLASTKPLLTWLRDNGYNDVRCQYLVNSADSQTVLDFCIKYNFDLSTNVTYGGSNSDEWLQKYHDAGLEISTWTFTQYCDYSEVQKWIDKGVEYVTCDWHIMSNLDLK